VHRTAESPEASIGRWRSDLPEEVAETIGGQLRAELRALRFET
jgi:hypothetical protein